MSSLYGWLNLSTTTRPSWALVCRQATGKEEWTIVKRKGVYMTAENEKAFDCLDKKHKKIFKLMALPYEWSGQRKVAAVADLPQLRWLWRHITEECFDAVHSLSFPYFSRYPHRTLPANNPNNDLQLMKRCRNLRKVEFTFVGAELENFGIGIPKPLIQLRREYRLDSMLDMFKLGELRSVVLRGPYSQGGGHSTLQELAAWLRGEYAIRANLHASLLNPQKKHTKAPSVVII